MGMGAVAGVGVAIERARRPGDEPGAWGWRVALVLLLAIGAAVEADSWRGALILWLAPIGAYQAAKVLAAALPINR